MVNIFRSEVMKLREEQKNAIQSFMLGGDTFVSLPTGIGKSLIYQLIIPLANELLIQGQTNETTNFSRQISKSPMLLGYNFRIPGHRNIGNLLRGYVATWLRGYMATKFELNALYFVSITLFYIVYRFNIFQKLKK